MSDGFNKFWKAYPRKVRKSDAIRAWRKHVGDKEAELVPVLLAAVEAWSKSRQWRDHTASHIPYPSTWLNYHQWEDEAQSEIRKKGDDRHKDCEGNHRTNRGNP